MIFLRILNKLLCLVGRHKPTKLTLNAFTWSRAYWEGDMQNARMISTPHRQRKTGTYCMRCLCKLEPEKQVLEVLDKHERI